MRWLLAFLFGGLRTCPVCHKWMDLDRPGGTVLMESWGGGGQSIALGANITHPTCHRQSCRGEWYDRDYKHHVNFDEPQVNSKPKELLVPQREVPHNA